MGCVGQGAGGPRAVASDRSGRSRRDQAWGSTCGGPRSEAMRALRRFSRRVGRRLDGCDEQRSYATGAGSRAAASADRGEPSAKLFGPRPARGATTPVLSRASGWSRPSMNGSLLRGSSAAGSSETSGVLMSSSARACEPGAVGGAGLGDGVCGRCRGDVFGHIAGPATRRPPIRARDPRACLVVCGARFGERRGCVRVEHVISPLVRLLAGSVGATGNVATTWGNRAPTAGEASLVSGVGFVVRRPAQPRRPVAMARARW